MATATTPHWEHFDHRADIGVRGFGATPAEAFAQAALAMTAVVTDPATVVPADEVAITCQATDLEFLLVEWLDALVYQMAVRRMLFSHFQVEVDSDGGHCRLRATAGGETVDRTRHQPAVEVKGATLTALAVRRDGGGWIAQCVIDV